MPSNWSSSRTDQGGNPEDGEDEDGDLQGGLAPVEPLALDDVVEDDDLHGVDRVHDHEDRNRRLGEDLDGRQVGELHGVTT
jgi:hypothetical protein